MEKIKMKSQNLVGIRCTQGLVSLLTVCASLVSSEKSGEKLKCQLFVFIGNDSGNLFALAEQ